MKIKKLTLIFLTILLSLTIAEAVSYKKHNIILSKAIRSYRGLPATSIKWKVIGKSNWGKKIYCKEFGEGEKLTLIIGGMHGDEPAATISAIKLAQYININPASIRNRVVIIPCINPDGLVMGRRTNGHKVDINRNFPTKNWSMEYEKKYNNSGKLPASEPETVIIVNVIEKYKPDLIIQMHQPFNALYPEKNTSAELLIKMSEISGFPVAEDLGYETPGSLGSYGLTLNYKVQGITYEMGAIDYEPDYSKVTKSLIEAINFQDN